MCCFFENKNSEDLVKVRTDPRMVAQLRTTFLKLAAAMEGAMVRLGEAGSKELYPVSQYYSSTLVTYIRTVLQVEQSSAKYHFLWELVITVQS